MLKRGWVVGCLWLVSALAHGDDLEAPAYILTGLDWYQTTKFRRAGYDEVNPVMGREPTQTQINSYFAVNFALLYLFNQTRFKRGANRFVCIVRGVTVPYNVVFMFRHDLL